MDFVVIRPVDRRRCPSRGESLTSVTLCLFRFDSFVSQFIAAKKAELEQRQMNERNQQDASRPAPRDGRPQASDSFDRRVSQCVFTSNITAAN